MSDRPTKVKRYWAPTVNEITMQEDGHMLLNGEPTLAGEVYLATDYDALEKRLADAETRNKNLVEELHAELTDLWEADDEAMCGMRERYRTRIAALIAKTEATDV